MIDGCWSAARYVTTLRAVSAAAVGASAASW